MKESITRRQWIKKLVCWSLALLFLAGIYLFQTIYLDPNTIDLLFTFVVFFTAFAVRGLYQETYDTMLFDMGDIELDCLKSHIEQILKTRKGNQV